MKKITISLIGSIALAFVAHAQTFDDKRQAEIHKIQQAVFAATVMYVDSVDSKQLADDAIRGMLSGLDPHSTYLNAEETTEEMQPMTGKFGGIGVQFNTLTDTVYIVQVIPGGPSEKAGILPGDRILTVDGENIAGVKIQSSSIMKLLRGEKGTKVKLGVQRGGKVRQVSITRGDIPIRSLEAYYEVPGTSIGYLRFSRFSQTTYDEFAKAVKELQRAGMKSLILDLRYNGGGILDQAERMASSFLPEGSVLLSVKNNREPSFDEVLRATGEEHLGLKKIPVVVLVNEFSASASEILAGAIQDHDRGLIVGRRTFGKGLVQRPIPLLDGSMIRLTVARYYTPSGRNIQKQYTKGNESGYELDILNRFKQGEMMHSDSIHFADSLKYRTLQEGRTIYGGGGIMPDVFVPLDTARYNKLVSDIFRQNIINRILPDYLDKERQRLKKKYPKGEDFIANYTVPDAFLDRLKPATEAEGIRWDDEQYAAGEADLHLRIKQFLVRELYDENFFYRMVNEDDPEYCEAIRLLSEEATYRRLIKFAEKE